MSSLIVKIVAQLARLMGASVVLLLGWALLDPRLGIASAAGAAVQAMLKPVGTAGPVGRTEWGIVVVALGVAFLLAALPKRVADRRRRPPSTAAHQAGDLDPHEPTVEVASPSDARHAHDTEVMEVRQRLSESGESASQSRLADLLKKSGDLCEAEGRLGDAIDAYEESAALRRNLVAGGSGMAREYRWLWVTLEVLADCREARGQRSRAAALYNEALEAADHALLLNPDDPEMRQHELRTRQEAARLEAILAI